MESVQLEGGSIQNVVILLHYEAVRHQEVHWLAKKWNRDQKYTIQSNWSLSHSIFYFLSQGMYSETFLSNMSLL